MTDLPDTTESKELVRITSAIDEKDYRRIHKERYGKTALPLWVLRPGLLAQLVDETLVLGRIDLAAWNCNVAYNTVKQWVHVGKREAELCEADGTIEYGALAQFYYEIHQAKTLFLSRRIRKIIELADSDDPADKALYKNFHLWLVENVDEEKRFSRWANMKQTTEETKNVNIRVTYANGDEWRNGQVPSDRTQDSIESADDEMDVLDTEMRQLEAGPPVEDF